MLGNVRGRAADASEGPGPGSRRSPLEKPSSTRAGGRGERWGVPHCLEEKEKTKSWVNARNFQVSIIVRKNLCKKKASLDVRKKSEISSPSRILDVPTKLFVSINVFDAKNISEIVRKEKLRRKSVTFFSV